MIWTILPGTCFLPFFAAATMYLTPVVIRSRCVRRCLLEGLGAADELGNLLGDLRLAGAVVLEREVADHVAGALGGGLHRHAAGDLLADRGVEKRLVEPDLERDWQQLAEDVAGVR